MDRFGRVLRRVDRRLEVREPERSRILQELAVDLADLYRAYRDRGCSEEEARRRAEEWLLPDEDSLDSLRRLNRPLLERVLGPLSEVGRSRRETAVLTVLSLGAVAAGLAALGTSSLLRLSDPTVGAVGVLGALGLGLAARRALDLVVGPARRRRAVLPTVGLPALSAAAVLIGALGGCLELAHGLTSAGAGASGRIWEAVGSAVGAGVLGLIVALLLELGWFWLEVRVWAIRRARAELRDVVRSIEHESTGG